MELRGQVVEFVRTQIAIGEDPYDEIVDDTVDYLTGEADSDEIRRLAEEVADAEFASFLVEQRGWPEVTDSDRLTAAFAELDRVGIVARENFACCQNCGHSEIGEEFPEGEAPFGYVFYHQQDAERGANGEGVYLAYDGKDQTEVGASVVRVLQSHGLRPQWDGSPTQRIHLPLQWRRRRTGELAVHPGAA
ncbi:hypothetical protein F4553_006168 [Allocatelliglobosispora scoriae]|uniref:DUF6891 domain-containing protein n=1 Tax=Allocatelliglobosispora scoriae TaxID=643052 RepID=A0A841BX52_9ACTN|nr:hypothetical protein [Allocatelliglobosispora scoriae]MBB5872734.1 hypothetical protein [Allocatelliglobosispora scoriae]